LKIAIESFRKFYSHAPILIIDNGSKDNSRKIIEEIRCAAPHSTEVLLLGSNTYHGPAMHQAMSKVQEEHVFFLDSDTETKQGGFLEAMHAEMERSTHSYGVGRQVTVNKRGFPAEKGITVLASAYMMIRRSVYLLLPPFEHHGLPVLKNFIAAQTKGYTLKSFPIEEFIEHQWRGTASRFGYGLGWRGKMEYMLNKIGL
jgi:glycosyltransferase involved in cell wall biosynthesis